MISWIYSEGQLWHEGLGAAPCHRWANEEAMVILSLSRPFTLASRGGADGLSLGLGLEEEAVAVSGFSGSLVLDSKELLAIMDLPQQFMCGLKGVSLVISGLVVTCNLPLS